MPLLDRFVPAPRVFPPPVTAAALRECVAFPSRRDPQGDAVHAALGCAYLASAGLATSLESIFFTLLVGYALLRLPNLWRGWGPLLASPVTWLLAASFFWTLIGGLWAPDERAWLHQLADHRALLVLPALYPIRRRWRLLIGALLAGMSVQGLIQLFQALGALPISARNPLRPAGLHSHPVHVSIFHAVAACAAIGWAVEARSRTARVLLLTTAALSLLGIGIAAGRAAMLGLAAALPILAFLLTATRHVSRGVILRGGAVAVIIVLIALGVLFATGADGLRRQSSDLTAVDVATTSTGQRFLWWRASLRAFTEDPILGAGPGATRVILAGDEEVRSVIAAHPAHDADFFVVAHPHSIYLQTLAEKGLIGGALLIALFTMIAIAAWRSALERPVRCGLAAGLVIWAVAAGFDAVQSAGRTAVLGGILITFVALPRRHPCEPPSAAGNA